MTEFDCKNVSKFQRIFKHKFAEKVQQCTCIAHVFFDTGVHFAFHNISFHFSDRVLLEFIIHVWWSFHKSTVVVVGKLEIFVLTCMLRFLIHPRCTEIAKFSKCNNVPWLRGSETPWPGYRMPRTAVCSCPRCIGQPPNSPCLTAGIQCTMGIINTL